MKPIYYHEPDEYLAQWILNLINAGHLPYGQIDTRDIREIRPSEINCFSQCHFFAGIGIWALSLERVGWPYHTPIWTASFSREHDRAASGSIETDVTDWAAFCWLANQCRPRVAIGDKITAYAGLAWIDDLSGNMASNDYAFWTTNICASSIGSPHIDQRLLFMATDRQHNPAFIRIWQDRQGKPASNFNASERGREHPWSNAKWTGQQHGKRFAVDPAASTVVESNTRRVEQIRAYGSSIVAPLATEFAFAVRQYLEKST